MVHNFSAGPCVLPKEVTKQAADAVVEFNNLGLSLVEISHRSKDFVDVMEEARSLVKELLNVPSNYEVLFLQGGASLGFLTTAYNFLTESGKAGYIDTGTWANKAIKEAKLLGNIEVLGSSKEDQYTSIPEVGKVPSGYDFVHYTSNNTIFGTQFPAMPQSDSPIICDMSSDIFSREINVADYDLIYAGAQKNMGPAGTVVYIVNKDKLGKTGRSIPSYLDLEVHIAKDSMFNTPPVFSVYTCMLTLRWLKKLGGVSAIQKINEQKAALIYNEIDSNPCFVGHAEKGSRSNMNATFRLTDESLAEDFDKLVKEANISGIKGHRSVGGYRASMYNALELQSVEALVNVMKELSTVKA